MLASTSVRNASDSTDLKAVFAEKFPVHGEEVKAFRRAHGDKKVGEITVDMVRTLKLVLKHLVNPYWHLFSRVTNGRI